MKSIELVRETLGKLSYVDEKLKELSTPGQHMFLGAMSANLGIVTGLYTSAFFLETSNGSYTPNLCACCQRYCC